MMIGYLCPFVIGIFIRQMKPEHVYSRALWLAIRDMYLYRMKAFMEFKPFQSSMVF